MSCSELVFSFVIGIITGIISGGIVALYIHLKALKKEIQYMFIELLNYVSVLSRLLNVWEDNQELVEEYIVNAPRITVSKIMNSRLDTFKFNLAGSVHKFFEEMSEAILEKPITGLDVVEL